MVNSLKKATAFITVLLAASILVVVEAVHQHALLWDALSSLEVKVLSVEVSKKLVTIRVELRNPTSYEGLLLKHAGCRLTALLNGAKLIGDGATPVKLKVPPHGSLPIEITIYSSKLHKLFENEIPEQLLLQFEFLLSFETPLGDLPLRIPLNVSAQEVVS